MSSRAPESARACSTSAARAAAGTTLARASRSHSGAQVPRVRERRTLPPPHPAALIGTRQWRHLCVSIAPLDNSCRRRGGARIVAAAECATAWSLFGNAPAVEWRCDCHACTRVQLYRRADGVHTVCRVRASACAHGRAAPVSNAPGPSSAAAAVAPPPGAAYASAASAAVEGTPPRHCGCGSRGTSRGSRTHMCSCRDGEGMLVVVATDPCDSAPSLRPEHARA